MTEQQDDDDPLLVRPYILGRPEAPGPRPDGETRPAWAVEPARRLPAYPDPEQDPAATAVITLPGDPDPAATVIITLPRNPEPATPPYRRLSLVGLALTLVTAAGLGIALGVQPSEPGTQPAFVAPPGPAVSAPATTTAAPTPTSPWVPATEGPATIPAAADPTTRAPTSRVSSTPTRATPTPASTLSPVPTVARVGAIRTDGGRCLGISGGYSFEGSYVQVLGCTNTANQVWTLATDGTLRVSGMCAQPADDRTVRVTRCDASAPVSQWRAGRNESLVHVATNDCLTASSGYGYRSVARVSDCTGADDQEWRLP